MNEISALYEGLSARSHEVTDFCFRFFREASTDFVHRKVGEDDHDARCCQVIEVYSLGLVPKSCAVMTVLSLVHSTFVRRRCWKYRLGLVRTPP